MDLTNENANKDLAKQQLGSYAIHPNQPEHSQRVYESLLKVEAGLTIDILDERKFYPRNNEVLFARDIVSMRSRHMHMELKGRKSE